MSVKLCYPWCLLPHFTGVKSFFPVHQPLISCYKNWFLFKYCKHWLSVYLFFSMNEWNNVMYCNSLCFLLNGVFCSFIKQQLGIRKRGMGVYFKGSKVTWIFLGSLPNFLPRSPFYSHHTWSQVFSYLVFMVCSPHKIDRSSYWTL